MSAWRLFVSLFIFLNCFFFQYGCSRQPQNSVEEKPKVTSSLITLSEESIKASVIRISPVKRETIREKVKVGGEAQLNPRLQSKVTPRTNGTVLSFHINVGDWVEKGDPLVTLNSREVAEARAEFFQAETRLALAKTRLRQSAQSPSLSQAESLEAKADLDVAEKNLKRAESLVQDHIISQKDYEIAKAEVQRAKSKLLIAKRGYTGFQGEYQETRIGFEKSKRTLQSLGVPLSGEGGLFTLLSPMEGVVTEQQGSLGQAVDSVTPLLTIVNPDPIWVMVDLYEKDFSKIKMKQNAFLQSAAYPGQVFHGRVSYISPLLEPHVRTAKARIILNNPHHVLKGGMFLQGMVVIREDSNALVIPHEALVVDNGQHFVYVEKSPGVFEPRKVILGIDEGERYEVVQGLSEGERIVTHGAFFLKSEQQKAKIGED